MKVILKLFLPLCIFSFVAFGISVAVLGLNPQDELNGNLTSELSVIEGDYDNIKVTASAFDVKLYPTDGSNTVIKASGKAVSDIKFNIEGDTLKLECTKQVRKFTDLFSVGLYSKGEVSIFVPDKQYKELYAHVMAGTTEINGVKAEKADLNLSAGDLIFANPEGWKNSELEVELSAGTCDIYNAATDSYAINMSAGDINVYGLTGEGKIDLSAGDASINYKELNGNVNVEASAGSVRLNLPEDASAEVICDTSAGSVTVKHGDIKHDIFDGDAVTIGGGKYDIYADISAGSIDIRDTVQEKNAPSIGAVPDTNGAATIATTAIASDNDYEEDEIEVIVGDVKVDIDPIKVEIDI